MPWGIAIGAVAGLAGSAMQSRAGERGANAQVAASNAATAEQSRQFNTTRQDMMPWLQAGRDALGMQQRFLSGDFSGFETSPDYAYSLEEGFKGLDRGAAAAGGLWSGGADADRIRLGQGLASQNANNYWNRLAGLSGTGQTTAGQLGQYGQSYAQSYGQNAMNAANARASSYANTANAWGNFGNQLAGYGAQYAGYRMGRG